MRNKLSDLNNHLFEQLERLNDEEITPEQLKSEIARSKAIASIGKVIVENANLVFKAKKYTDELDLNNQEMPDVLKIGNK